MSWHYPNCEEPRLSFWQGREEPMVTCTACRASTPAAFVLAPGEAPPPPDPPRRRRELVIPPAPVGRRDAATWPTHRAKHRARRLKQHNH